MVFGADVSSLCVLPFCASKKFGGFYFRDVMQFPVLSTAFLSLCNWVADMVLVADVSSCGELRLCIK